ncbi:MAG: alpha-L-rhamnosidase [Tannerellaceae bacterium]|jgi:hypothetical protein|nr:alpha-L-rhamnosidase [Tannerellaceae bacterium]
MARIRSPKPMLGWVVNSDKNNTLQTAYRILVASSPTLLAQDNADMWDSGRTPGSNSVAVQYEGKPLHVSSAYFWKVKVWNNRGEESPFSAIRAFFTHDEFDGKTGEYPLQITDEYPVGIKVLNERHYLLDFGRDAFGRLRLTLTSAGENDTATVRLGEAVKDGKINRSPGATIRYAEYRLPLQSGTHTYIIKIRPDSRNTDTRANESAVLPILMPDYTGEVLPFRYCELENCDVVASQVVRQTVHYPFDNNAATFNSSDSVLNSVWEMCKYSVRATSFAGLYIDGDRERIPYEADALINQLCHYVADREFTIARRSHEYLIEHPTWPTEWIMQSVIMAWNDFLYTGNSASLRCFYDDLKAKCFTDLREKNGLISTKTGRLTPAVLAAVHFKGKNMRDIVDWPQSEMDGFVHSTYNAVVNAYHYQSLCLLSKIADAIGYQRDKEDFARQAAQMKIDFNRAFFDAEMGYYKDGADGDRHFSLHANMFALAFNLVPEKNVKTVEGFVRSRGMACSVYGSQFLGDAVYNAGDGEYGLKLLASTGERSWYNMIRAGSTIAMEAWDNKYKPNQDWNHIWGAAALNIIARKLMGIEPIEPGFARIRIKPQPGSLRQAEIKMPSIRGDICVSFNNSPDGIFTLDVNIPANSVAEIWLPKVKDKYSLTVDNLPHKGTPTAGFIKVETGSGRHVFSIR